ncbi:hypothetical protein [Vibrio sp. 1F255]|uniref:hypothetical protein n=1 Tax=Vibrio sp. 1F255 TaxID=3230009 RepID=UPI00352C9D61
MRLELNKERLLSLIEMKIIHLYKTYEILLKELLLCAFPNFDQASLYKWDSVKTLMNEHRIPFGSLNEYAYVDQLRKVNNNIKHSSFVENNVQNTVPSLKGIEKYDHENLEDFYQSVKGQIKPFLNDVASGIQDYLYNFPSERIEGIVEDYSLRMESKELEIFAEKLLKSAEEIKTGDLI